LPLKRNLPHLNPPPPQSGGGGYKRGNPPPPLEGEDIKGGILPLLWRGRITGGGG